MLRISPAQIRDRKNLKRQNTFIKLVFCQLTGVIAKFRQPFETQTAQLKDKGQYKA